MVPSTGFIVLSCSVAPSLTSTASAAQRTVRNAAVRALLHELATYPKPGLVSLVDSGSHADMNAATFVRSSWALRGYFAQMAAAGAVGAGFETLRALGIDAETRMRATTRGINTHRGAIFQLGLLAAAAGRRRRFDAGSTPTKSSLGDIVSTTWGRAIAAHPGAPASHGRQVRERFGAGGARAEAAAGLPSIYRIALPAYRHVLRTGGSANPARVQAFFALMATLEDTNLLYRGGLDGLRFAQQQARAFLDDGGVHAEGWQQEAVRIHHRFIERRLSPGGSADLLAACLFVDAIER